MTELDSSIFQAPSYQSDNVSSNNSLRGEPDISRPADPEFLTRISLEDKKENSDESGTTKQSPDILIYDGGIVTGSLIKPIIMVKYGVWKHKRTGNLYILKTVSYDQKTLEVLVQYRQLYISTFIGGKQDGLPIPALTQWSRNLTDFLEKFVHVPTTDKGERYFYFDSNRNLIL